MNYVDYEEVVSESVAIIGLSGDDEIAKNFIRTWLWRGLQSLGTSEQMLQDTKVHVKNLLIKKPKMKKLEEIALYDVNGNFIPHIWQTGKRIYPNVEQYSYDVVLNEGTDEEETVTYYTPVDLSENKECYVLGTNGIQVSYALIRYWGYPLDSAGMPLIREDEVEALTLYARYKWSQRKNENQSEIRENKITWQQAADICRAEKKGSDMTNEKRKKIAADFNRMLPNFNRSRN